MVCQSLGVQLYGITYRKTGGSKAAGIYVNVVRSMTLGLGIAKNERTKLNLKTSSRSDTTLYVTLQTPRDSFRWHVKRALMKHHACFPVLTTCTSFPFTNEIWRYVTGILRRNDFNYFVTSVQPPYSIFLILLPSIVQKARMVPNLEVWWECFWTGL